MGLNSSFTRESDLALVSAFLEKEKLLYLNIKYSYYSFYKKVQTNAKSD